MAFGEVDHVINHVSGERKAITNIDMDKEYGKKGYSNPNLNINLETLHKQIEERRLEKLEEILCFSTIPSKVIKEPYDIFIILDEKQKVYKWKEDAIRALHGTMLDNLHLALTKRVDSNYEFYYIDCNGNCTDYKNDPYSPINTNFNL